MTTETTDFQEDCMRRFKIRLFLLLTALLLSLPALAQQDVITTAIGGGPNGIPALDSNLYTPDAVAADSSGNYYISAYYQNRIFKVNSGGTLTVLAGDGAQGFSGDGVTGGAANAYLYHPYGLAVDGSGNVYFADQYNCVVRKVDTANTITTIAGIGNSCGYGGDGGKGTAAQLYYPGGVALDGLGNLFIADTSNCRIRKLVLSTGTITTSAGNGTCGYLGDTGAATAAEVYNPYAIAADSTGNVFIADTNNYRIREVTKSDGKINTIAGTGAAGFGGDGGKAVSAQIYQVFGLAVDSTGKTVTFGDYQNQRVRQFTVGGNISTVAGTGTAGFTGDGAAATSAELYYPQGVGVSSSKVYVADSSNYRIRLFTVGGNINTIAGNGSYNLPTLLTGMPPQGVVFYYPFGVFGDASGNVFVNDTYNFLVRELVASSDLVNFFAGTGTAGFTGDSGLATKAEINYNDGVVKDSKGNIYIADTNNCVIRMVNTAGNISTFAGVGQRCAYTGDGGPATSAELYYPSGVAVDGSDNVYIADTYNHVIRQVKSGTINTIAGIGQRGGYSGDGGPATAAQLYYPYGVAADGPGNVFIADTYNCRIREVSVATGVISTVAGTGSCAYTGDGPATEEAVNNPQGIRADANDNLFIADTNNQRLRWVSAGGVMTTFAGIANAGYFGDGGVATSAELYYPSGISEDSSGNFLVADQYNFRIRGISAFAALSTAPGSLNFGLTSVGSTSPPESLTISAVGPLTISDISVTGPYSEVDDCPASMPNGTTCTMYVYFTPTGSGNATGTVTMSTNGFFNPASTISLTGLGTAISITGAPVNFGNQLVKTASAVKTVTVTNTGTTAITMGTISLSETTDFAIASNTCPASGSKLNGGANCSIGVTFTPASTGAKKGAVLINDSDPTSPQLAGLSGTGISNVSLSPTSVTFATTAIGVTSAASKITVTNNTAGSITLGTPAVTATVPFLNMSTTTCTNGKIIASKGTCVINVAFKPTVVGFVKGSVSLFDNDPTSPQSATLRGTGTGIKFTPASINFGTVNRGTTVSDTVTVANVGTTTVTFTGAEISGTNSADFGQSGGNPPCGGSLKAGASCNFSVTFDPSKDAVENAAYKLFDNSPGSPQTLPLTGKGQN
jgi:sugar lactone lactonase YvrE